MLRASLFGIIGLSFLLCIFGLIAPAISPDAAAKKIGEGNALHVTPPSQESPPEHQEGSMLNEDQIKSYGRHLLALLTAFAIAGIALGASTSILHIDTNASDAFRYSFISASVLGLTVTLVSFPYIFQSGSPNFVLFHLSESLLVWQMFDRMILGPLVCAVFGLFSFSFVEAVKPESQIV